MDPKTVQVLGRLGVARSLRFDSGPAAEAPPARPAPDALCPRCGVVLCEAARRAVFAGMVLQCTGCGEKTRVERAR